MSRASLFSHLVGLLVALCLTLKGWAQEEEPVFSGDEAAITEGSSREVQRPDHPATAYWKISAVVDLQAAPPGTHVQMLMPLSDERQSILERRTSAEGVRYREEADGLNLWGHWLVTQASETPRQLTYEYTVQIVDTVTTVPTPTFPVQKVSAHLQPYLAASARIQSDADAVIAQARSLTRKSVRADQALWSIYHYVYTLRSPEVGGEKSDAVSVVTSQRGSRVGKTRALVALLRAAGIPARIVGGIRLGDTPHKRTTISWVEAHLGDTWVPLDPSAGYFAWLPNTYLALYRNDLPLLIHTRKIPVEYTFFIRPVSRNAVLTSRSGNAADSSHLHQGGPPEAERMHVLTTYVDHPRANIVVLNDGPIPQRTIDQILAEARSVRVNVAFLSVDFDSSYFREHALQSLVSNNLSLIREADLLLVHTVDTAGMYALLKQGELGLRLDDLRVIMTSRVPRFVSTVFAAVLESLLKPAEIVLLSQSVDVLALWQVGTARIQTLVAPTEYTEREPVIASVVNAETVARLGWWRRQVVRLWTLAVQSQVPLSALSFILVLPLIAFFLVILRNVIGLETFGTFSPMLLALAFLTTGLIWGMLVFGVIVGLGTGLRLALQGLRLHLVARVAILIAVVAVGMVGMTVLGATLGIGALLHVSVFPMVIMANTIENFTNTQLERGTGEALRLTLHTLLVATVSYIGIESTGLKPLVLAFPELLMLIIGIELLLGRWRGLRVLEYLRFLPVLHARTAQQVTEVRKASIG